MNAPMKRFIRAVGEATAESQPPDYRYRGNGFHFLLKRVSCESTHIHCPFFFTHRSVARSSVLNSCPVNLPVVVVNAVTAAELP